MEKTEWPTKERLKDLRSQGLFAFSGRLATTFGLLFLVLAFFASSSQLGSFKEYFQKLNLKDSNFPQILQIASSGATIVITAMIVFVSAYLLSALIQSKFYFSFSNFGFGFRKNHLASAATSNPFKRFFNLSLSFISALILAYLTAISLLSLLLKVLVLPKDSVLTGFYNILQKYLFLFLAFAIMIAIFSFAVAKVSFMLRYRMAKQEIESQSD